MSRQEIEKDYFEWMFDLVCEGRYASGISYRMLLSYLHDVEFTYLIPKDSNRAADGIDLRYRFAYEYYRVDDANLYIEGPCSVLEMMIALAIRCEEGIMDDPGVGNRTGQWFWKMITNMGLGGMTDRRFDTFYVESVVARFLDREYDPDGRGGLFIIRNCDYDLRDVEIWHQLLWFLDGIT